MKKALKYIFGGLLVLSLLLVGVVALWDPPARALTDLQVELTPERVARGTYLAESVLECANCHTRSDYGRLWSPPVGPVGGGGDCFEEAYGRLYGAGPSVICIPNITPHPEAGVGAWTDDELARAIREGVDRDGKAMYSWMRFYAYRNLSDEDTYALVAWMRSLEPVADVAPETRHSFLNRFLTSTLPKPVEEPVPHPDPSDPMATGEYLAKVAGCQSCHTPFDTTHSEVGSQEFSGGDPLITTHGPVFAANLTPHPTGLIYTTVDGFKARMRVGAAEPPPGPTNVQTVMPWQTYAGMSDADLEAIFTWLRAQNPVERRVLTFPDPASYADSEEPEVRCADIPKIHAETGVWPESWRPCTPS